MDDYKGWLIAAGAAAGSAATWVWRLVERGDTRMDRAAAERTSRETALYERQDHQLDAAYKRIADLQAEGARTEADRDRGWDLARAWFQRAHDARHDHLNLVHSILARREMGRGLDGWDVREPPKLPTLNNIIPRAAEPEPPP